MRLAIASVAHPIRLAIGHHSTGALPRRVPLGDERLCHADEGVNGRCRCVEDSAATM